VVSGLLEVAISLVLFAVVALVFKLKVTAAILAFPLFLFLNIVVGLSIAIWLSTLTIRFKDLQHIIPYFINFGIWITPVFYPSTIVPEKYASVLYFNPIAGVLDGYRWALLGTELPSLNFAYSILFSILLFLAGLLVFVRKEPEIADFI
jgi:lipopolysaccharide transport system permease protein